MPPALSFIIGSAARAFSEHGVLEMQGVTNLQSDSRQILVYPIGRYRRSSGI